MKRVLDIEQQAARWLMRRDEPDWSPGEQRIFEDWLGTSFAHKAAFWRLEHGWRAADRLAAVGRASEPVRLAASPGRGWRAVAAAAVLLTMIAGDASHPGWLDASGAPAVRRYATATGIRRNVPLADGSDVELNTASTMRAVVTPERRDVWLDRGEAYFEVAHLGGRPFVVHAGTRTITVLGTKFAVRLDDDRVTVSVVEGRVRVEDAAEPDDVPAAIITAGDVAVARGRATLLAAKSDERVAAALSWRSGWIEFDGTPLAEAVAEFNRYDEKKIVIGDDRTGAIRIGGTFEAANVSTFLRLLHDAYGIKVETEGESIKISS